MSRTTIALSLMAAFGSAACITGSADADVVVLDFAEDSGFSGDTRFEVVRNDLLWTLNGGSEEGFGTEGVLWGRWETQSVGSLEIIAEEGFEISGISFDISGYGQYESAAVMTFSVDGAEVQSEDYQFAGNTDLYTVEIDGPVGREMVIHMDNCVGYTYVGLDNVTFNINAIPAPGALALLGVAGIVGKRRRRTA